MTRVRDGSTPATPPAATPAPAAPATPAPAAAPAAAAPAARDGVDAARRPSAPAVPTTAAERASAGLPPPQATSVLDPFRPDVDYRRGELNRPLTTSAGMPHRVTSHTVANAFSAGEQAEIKAIVAKGGNATDADVRRLAAMTGGSADKLAAFTNLITYETAHMGGTTTYSPIELLRKMAGVCRDQHVFLAYAQNSVGIEGNAVGYGAPGVHHAITTRKDPATGKWDIIEYGRVHHVQAASEEEALARVTPDAFTYWKYEKLTSPVDRPKIKRFIETQHGLELKRFMSGRNVGGRTIDTHTTGSAIRSGVNASVSENATTLSADHGRFGMDVRAYNGSNPMLEDAFSAAVRFRATDNLTLSLGYVGMPEAFSYTVGPREKQSVPLSVGFFGVDYAREVYNLPILGGGKLRLTGDVDASAAGALALNHKDSELDTGVSAGLSYAHLNVRNRLTYDVNDQLSLWASHTTHLGLDQIGTYAVTAGTLSGAPVTHFGEAGVDLHLGRFNYGMSVYVPVDTYTNLYADTPQWQNTLSLKLDERGDHRLVGVVAGDFEGNLRNAYVGYKFHDLTIAAGAEQTPMDKDPHFAATISLDVGKTLGRIFK